ncbi:MAG: glutamate 5-kinase [bacterium]
MHVVVKIGTNVLSNADGTLDAKWIGLLVGKLVAWHTSGWQVVMVSSGSIGAGIGHLGWKERPKTVRDKQAAAAVGQVQLMGIYNSLFNALHVKIAQILLTREDLMDHKRYLNTRNTIMALLDLGIIPIINENDTVSVDEIVLGDNDTLAAIVSMKVEAQKLIILTDVDGLYSCDPKTNSARELIAVVEKIGPEIEKLCSSKAGSIASIGGMQTKIQAAKVATRAGVEVIIANGRKENTLDDIFANKAVGTTFVPEKNSLKSKKRWIAFGAKIKGKIVIDDGAVNALSQNNKSLLPAGIVSVQGQFASGDIVSIMDLKKQEIARGISSYSSDEIGRTKGKKTTEIKDIIQKTGYSEVIHRDNLVIL